MSGLRRARQIVAARLEDFFTVPVATAGSGFVDGCFRWTTDSLPRACSEDAKAAEERSGAGLPPVPGSGARTH